MADDVAASVLESLRDPRPLTSSTGGVGVHVGVGMSAGGFDLKRRRITNNEGGWKNQLDDLLTTRMIQLKTWPRRLPSDLVSSTWTEVSDLGNITLYQLQGWHGRVTPTYLSTGYICGARGLTKDRDWNEPRRWDAKTAVWHQLWAHVISHQPPPQSSAHAVFYLYPLPVD